MSDKPKMFTVTRTPKGLDKILSVKPDVAAAYYCAVINVADTPCATFDYQGKVPSFWFPINEIGNWGYSPFFGTIKVVNQYFKGDKPVLIHCHAGANRSPSHAFAVMLAKGYTIKEIEESLNYPNLHLNFKRNIDRKHIPSDIVEFLKAVDAHPDLSLEGVRRRIDENYDEWSRDRYSEQTDCIVSTGNGDEKVRMVYNRDTKRYVVQNSKVEPWIEPLFKAREWHATPIVPPQTSK